MVSQTDGQQNMYGMHSNRTWCAGSLTGAVEGALIVAPAPAFWGRGAGGGPGGGRRGRERGGGPAGGGKGGGGPVGQKILFRVQ